MKKISSSKTALHLALLTALAFTPFVTNAGHIDTTQDTADSGAWTSVITGTTQHILHIYDASSGELKVDGGTKKPDSFTSLTVNVGTTEISAIAQANIHGLYIPSLPTSANNSFTFDGPLTINVNPGSVIQANLYGIVDFSSGSSAQDMLNLSSGNIIINIHGNDDPSQKEGSVYGYYANSGSFTSTTLKDISIFAIDSEEIAGDATNTGGIYGIHFDKTYSTLTAGNILIDVEGGYDSKGTYGYHSDQSTATGSVVNIDSITLSATNYQGGEGYLRGIEKQGNETLNVGNVSVTGFDVAEGRITGIFSRGGDINVKNNVQLYIRDVTDGNPQDDNFTGIWLARGGNINVGGSVVVTYEDDKGINPTFDQNVTGIGIMKVDHVGTTITATQNATVNVGGNLIVQLAGNAESVGLKNHSVYGTVNNGQSSSINFAEGSKRYLYFGTDTHYVNEEQVFSSLDSNDEPTTFQGSFSNFDAIVVTSGSSLQLSAGQTHALVGDDDLFATTAIKDGQTTVGFAPVLNFVDFLKGNKTSNNVSEGVINGIVSMGGVLSMPNGTFMDIRQDGSANIWLLQNESGATINVDGTLELTNASVYAVANGAVSHPFGTGDAYNKGEIFGNGKLALQAATPADTITYHTYTYTGKTNTTDITAGKSVFENSGLIGVSTLEIGKDFELKNTGGIYVDNLTATQAIIESTGIISVADTMELAGTEITTSGTTSAKAIAISEESKVFSDGNITTDILTVNNGTLKSGESSENVAIKTNNFAFNQGEILINNGTFDAYQTASLTGGTFILGSDSTTVEVQLNPVTISKSTPLNLNTGFEINSGSKLGLGTQTVLSQTKTIFDNLGLDATSKTVLAVNKSIVTGNSGYINVDYSSISAPPAVALIALEGTEANASNTSNGLHFGSNSILAIEVNENSVIPNQSSSSVFTSATGNSSVVVDSGATVVLYGDIQPGQYNITKGYEIGDQTVNGWDHQKEGEVVVYVKDAANLDWTFERGTYLKSDGYDNDYVWLNVISHEDIQDVYPDINIPDISNDAFDNCKARSGQFICGVFRDDDLDSDQKTEIVNTVSAIAFTGGVMASAMNDLNYGFGALYSHLTMDSDTFAAQGQLWPEKEKNNFWIDVIGHWTRSKHLNGTGLNDVGYRDSTYGFILGYDHKFENYPFAVGIAFSYLDGKLKGDGDIVRTINKHQSYGAHFYANYSPNEHINLIGSLHWLRNNADLNEHINTASAKNATASANTDLFAVGLRAETTLNVGIISVIPHIEPRYIYGKTHSFGTKIDDRKIWDTNFGGNNLFQIPVGVALRTDIKTKSGWNIRPTLDVQVIPQVGSTSQRMEIRNSSGVANEIYGQYQGKFAAEAKFGMSVDKGPWTFGVKYGFGGGSKGRYEHGFNFEGRFRW